MAERRLSDAKFDEKIDRLLKLSPVPELSTEVHRKIAGVLTASLHPVKPLPKTRVLAAQFAATFLALAVALIAVIGSAGFRTLDAWQASAILAILAAGVALFSVVMAWQIRPASVQKISAQLSWACFGVGFLGIVALLFPWRGSDAFASRGWPCLLGGTVFAIPGGILFWLLTRRGVPLSLGTFGGTLGAMAGLLGVTVLQFRCIYQDSFHLLVWHGAVPALCIALAGLFGFAIERNGEGQRSG